MDLGFLDKFTYLIMTCMTTFSYSLLLNGGLNKPFKANRGIRQGDLMPPYLFVLAMEYLGRELSHLTANGDFNFHPRCRKLKSIHICFEDNLCMYYMTDLISVKLLNKAFTRFSQAVGLQANLDKNSLYIAGVSKHVKKKILNELGYIKGVMPFRYLGVPLAARKLSVSHYFPLIEKITSRVTCWSAMLLSYAGRLQLVKSVLFGVQAYWAQIFIIPKKVLKAIEQICRTFVWIDSVTPCAFRVVF